MTHPIYDTYQPDGFSTINSYLFVEKPKELIDFYKKAFYAEELSRTVDEESGTILNCILKIGQSCFMLAQAADNFLGMSTSFYLYVNDVDVMFENVIKAGAQEVFPPRDMDYVDRQGGVMDIAGNYWWISKRLVKGGYEEE